MEKRFIGIMEFRASVFPHGVTKIPELTEGGNHPCTRLWIFVVRVRDVVGILRRPHVRLR